MALNPGSALGVYEVLSKIGEGGMGEVYQARDTKLDRDVALKVLPEAFTQDADRLARFEREAKVLASLNHPNIASIYGLEEQGDTRALVLELVEGPTLADRITQGPIPIDEALPIARQIAEALEAAHEAGVIHRDLKPANVKVRDDGTVKVLDFGLAKALDPTPDSDPSQSPTLTAAATQMGVIMGTAAYMSPEQARGKTVDRRTDIWAFGCVLFEILTGRRTFEGEDISLTLADVMRAEPEWSALPTETPAHIQTLLRRCLQKDLQRRVPHIGVARIEIDEGPAESASPQGVVPPAVSGSVRSRTGWVVAGVLLVSTLGLAGVLLSGGEPPIVHGAQLVMTLPPNVTLAPGGRPDEGGLHPLAISPDGRDIVFVGVDSERQRSLWIRPLNSDSAMELPGTQGAASPFWSPDSESVAFFAVGDLKRVDRTGGAVTTIGPAAGGVRGAWSPDGQVFMNTLGFGRITQVVPASGGQPIPVPDVQDTPYLLPDGQHYVYRDFAEDGRPLFIASLGSNERTPLELRIDTLPVVYSQGHLLFVRDGALMAQPFDARVLELSGEAAVLAEDVSVGTLMPGGGVFSVSETGVLVYQKTPRDVDSTLMWLDRRGAPGGVVAESGAYSTVELSPDARQAAVTIFDPATGSRGIWLFDLSRPGIRTPFTTDFPGGNPVWTPDGSRIVFMDDRETGQAVLAERMVGRTGSMDILLDDSYNNRPTSWSPDGDLLLFTKTSSYLSPVGTFGDVWGYPMEGDREPFPILQTPAREHHGRLSPDGRWMAYSSDESGRTEVYVVPFPDLQTTTPVSANGGSIPRWSRDGTELVYLGADDMLMAVSLTEVDERLEVGPAQPLFQVRPPPARAGQRVVGGAYIYDVMPDGRFLVNMADGEPEPSSIEVVLNWLDMLEE